MGGGLRLFISISTFMMKMETLLMGTLMIMAILDRMQASQHWIIELLVENFVSQHLVTQWQHSYGNSPLGVSNSNLIDTRTHFEQ